ncbi:MAG: Minf_1886 family protein [Phycisphaerales bacterium]
MSEIKVDWKKMREAAGPYPPEAFQFVREGLAHTVGMIHGEGIPETPTGPASGEHHVSGKQLCNGLRDYALGRYGMLARTVLARWGIRRTEDFGRIVFGMIEVGIMRRSAEDSFDDFRGVFDFDEAFATAEV